MTDLILEQIKLLSKQLKVPTFSHYPDIIRQSAPDTGFEELLLALMKNEYEQLQENNNRIIFDHDLFLPHKLWYRKQCSSDTPRHIQTVTRSRKIANRHVDLFV